MSDQESVGDGADLDDGAPASERRGDTRHLACFPAHLQTDGGVQRTALIRDLSISGALLLTRAKLEIGDAVRLSLFLKDGEEPRFTTAKVVRNERRTVEMAHPWTKVVAVQFDEPIAELEPEARALAARQAALAGRKPVDAK